MALDRKTLRVRCRVLHPLGAAYHRVFSDSRGAHGGAMCALQVCAGLERPSPCFNSPAWGPRCSAAAAQSGRSVGGRIRGRADILLLPARQLRRHDRLRQRRLRHRVVPPGAALPPSLHTTLSWVAACGRGLWACLPNNILEGAPTKKHYITLHYIKHYDFDPCNLNCLLKIVMRCRESFVTHRGTSCLQISGLLVSKSSVEEGHCRACEDRPACPV